MAHEIHCGEDGQYSMMYVGEEPWHGLGKKLDSPATASEAIIAAKLNWKVVKQPLYVGTKKQQIFKDRFAVVREDLFKKKQSPIFGVVGKDYVPLQNTEAFDFFDPITGKGAAIYHTAGALGEGERVWLLAKLPSHIRVANDDIIDKYLLLSNSHDGKSSVQIKFTPIRVVCNNTLTLALSQGPTLRISHTKDLHNRLRNAEAALGIINKRYEFIDQRFNDFVRIQLNSARLEEYISAVFLDPIDPEDHIGLKRVQKDRALAKHLFENGKGNGVIGVRGSLWAAYNGVTELIDHRQTRQDNDRRLNSLWFGDGYHIKARAYRVAEEKIKSWA